MPAMDNDTAFDIGSLVRVRGREWVVLPPNSPDGRPPDPDVLMLRPLDGTDDEVTGIYVPLERPEPARFDLPDPQTDLGNHLSCGLLRDAVRLGFRSGAGPFRSLARVAIEPRPYQLVPLVMALKLDHHDEALRHAQQGLDIRRRVLGHDHPHTAQSLHSVAMAHSALNQHKKSLAHLRDALRIQRQLHGEQHTSTLNTLRLTVACLVYLGRKPEAYELLRNYLRALPGEHPAYTELARQRDTLLGNRRKKPGKRPRKRRR